MDIPQIAVEDTENAPTNRAVQTRKKHSRVPPVVSHERMSENMPEGPWLDGIEKFIRVEMMHPRTPRSNTAPGAKYGAPSRPFLPVKAEKRPRRKIPRPLRPTRPRTVLYDTEDTPEKDGTSNTPHISAAQKVVDHLERGPSDQNHEDFFISLIGRNSLDDQALDNILTTADSIFFARSLSKRVQWAWSAQDLYRSAPFYTTIRPTTIGSLLDRPGFETVITLSAPILKNPKYTTKLLVSVFLQALIDSYIYIESGFEAKRYYNLMEFNNIAPRIREWIGERCTMLLNLSVTKADLKDFEKER